MDAFIIRVIKFIIKRKVYGKGDDWSFIYKNILGWLVKKVLSKSDFTNVPIKVVLLSKIGDGG